MENKDINTSKFGIGLFIGILLTLVLVMGGYLVYDKVIKKDEVKDNSSLNENKDNKSTSEQKEDTSFISSYELKDEGVSCKRLYINNKKTDIVGSFYIDAKTSQLVVLEGAIVNASMCQDEFHFIDGTIYVINSDGKTFSLIGSNAVTNGNDDNIKSMGGFARKVGILNDKIIIDSDNGSQDPESVISGYSEAQKLQPFEYIEEFTYDSKTATFSSKILETITAKDYKFDNNSYNNYWLQAK